jgi:hypothetical protein
MIEAFVEKLGGCRLDRDFFKVHSEAERTFTPLEIHALLERASGLPQPTQAWLNRITRFTRFREGPPMRYRRNAISANIDLYSDPDAPPSGKRLIIGFCGTAQRLLMPVASMLQLLPGQECDLVVLRDPTLRHFMAGVASYADSFSGLLKSLAADLSVHEYRRLYCYGTCMGGFAALRAGLLLRAQRSISVSGVFPWHVRRLLEEPDKELPAFDPLCDCYRGYASPLVCAYSMSHERDREHAARLSRIIPAEHLAAPGMSAHNLVEKLAQRNALRMFFELVFDLPAGERSADADTASAPVALFHTVPVRPE